ncbi:MAG: response regulator transcription factor [Granulosicoccus sp.]|nr:response regulator transcription factor [Granulosicoccus sp.]
MIDCTRTEHAVDQMRGFYCQGERGRVVVFANEFNDAVLASDMLARCGYELQQSLTTVADNESFALYAAVVCHRVGENELTMELLKRIRAKRVIVLSDCCDEPSIVKLLNSGAHYYFNRSDSARVLSARIDAALRQHSACPIQHMYFGDIHFNARSCTVRRGGELIRLSPKEYELAYYLFSNQDRIVGNAELMSVVWSLPQSMDSRRIDTAACRIRKKLELTPDRGWYLKRIRMFGYRLISIQPSQQNKPFKELVF